MRPVGLPYGNDAYEDHDRGEDDIADSRGIPCVGSGIGLREVWCRCWIMW
jgi:hypothetical protein